MNNKLRVTANAGRRHSFPTRQATSVIFLGWGVLAADVTFKGPFATLPSTQQVVGALHCVPPVWERRDLRAALSPATEALERRAQR